MDGNQFIGGIRPENPVARVQLFALLPLDDEEPIALDGQIRRAGTELERPLSEIRTDLGHLHAHADLPRIGATVVIRRLRSRLSVRRNWFAKITSEALKPTVCELARLLPATSICVSAARQSGQRGGHRR